MLFDENDYPRRETYRQMLAREAAERAIAADERETHAAAARAFENTFEETATCVDACFELGATAHATACQNAQALAAPVAEALTGWLGAIALRRAA